MDGMSIFMTIIVGGLAGWIASLLIGGGGGLIKNVIVGVIGAFIGSFVFDVLDLSADPTFTGSLIVATVGATILLFLVKLLK